MPLPSVDSANDRMIARNPARGIDLPRMRTTEMRILDHDEIRALAGEMAHRYSPTVSLAAYCVLRSSIRRGRWAAHL